MNDQTTSINTAMNERLKYEIGSLMLRNIALEEQIRVMHLMEASRTAPPTSADQSDEPTA